MLLFCFSASLEWCTKSSTITQRSEILQCCFETVLLSGHTLPETGECRRCASSHTHTSWKMTYFTLMSCLSLQWQLLHLIIRPERPREESLPAHLGSAVCIYRTPVHMQRKADSLHNPTCPYLPFFNRQAHGWWPYDGSMMVVSVLCWAWHKGDFCSCTGRGRVGDPGSVSTLSTWPDWKPRLI